jgi:hypothetical protein
MKNLNKFYVYAHQRLDDDSIFYIGKGTGKRAWSEKMRNKHWKSIVKKADYRVLILQDGMTETDAFTLEKFLIVFYGREDLGEGRLVNMTDGGDGASGFVHSEEFRKKLSEDRKGKTRPPFSEETRKKMSEAHKGRTYPPKSEAAPQKRSEATKARKMKEKQTQDLEDIKFAQLIQAAKARLKNKL